MVTYKIKLPPKTERNLDYWLVRIEGDRLIPIRECASLFTAMHGNNGTDLSIKEGYGVIERISGKWYVNRIHVNPKSGKAGVGSLPMVNPVAYYNRSRNVLY